MRVIVHHAPLHCTIALHHCTAPCTALHHVLHRPTGERGSIRRASRMKLPMNAQGQSKRVARTGMPLCAHI